MPQSRRFPPALSRTGSGGAEPDGAIGKARPGVRPEGDRSRTWRDGCAVPTPDRESGGDLSALRFTGQVFGPLLRAEECACRFYSAALSL